MNKVFISGNMTRDPNLRSTNDGRNVLDFGLAVQMNSNDAEFFTVVAWDKNAEYVARYGAKGRRVLVEGRLVNKSWVDKEGNKRDAVQIYASRCEFIDGRKTSGAAKPEQEGQQPDTASEAAPANA